MPMPGMIICLALTELFYFNCPFCSREISSLISRDEKILDLEEQVQAIFFYVFF